MKYESIKEEFRPIIMDDWTKSEKYTISNYGRVFNAETRMFVEQVITGKVGNDYFCVNLQENSKQKRVLRKVHVLMAKTWLSSEYQEGYEVDHKDINRFNNCLDNLRWVSRKTNANNKTSSLHIKNPNTINIEKFMTENFPEHIDNTSVVQFAKRHIYSEKEVGFCIYATHNYIKYGKHWNNFLIDFDGVKINYTDFINKYKLPKTIHIFKDDLLKTIAMATFGFNGCFGRYGIEQDGMWFLDKTQVDRHKL